jgi:hypothetical protein
MCVCFVLPLEPALHSMEKELHDRLCKLLLINACFSTKILPAAFAYRTFLV